MPTFRASADKLMDVSFSNWVLGGSLISIVEAETVNKHGKTSRKRKGFIQKPDGTTQELEEPQCELHNHDPISIEIGDTDCDEAYESKEFDKAMTKSKKKSKSKHSRKHKEKVEAVESASGTEHEKPASPKKDKKKGDDKTKKDEDKKGGDGKGEDKKSEDKKSEDTKGEDKKGEDKKDGEKATEASTDVAKPSNDNKPSEEEKPSEETTKAAESESAESKPAESKSDDSEEKSNKGKKNGVEFTAEQDATILSMKADNKSWKDIMTALDLTNKSAIAARFKELQNSKTETEKKVSSPKPAETEPANSNDSKSKEKEIEKNSPAIDPDFGFDLFGSDANDVGTPSEPKNEDSAKEEESSPPIPSDPFDKTFEDPSIDEDDKEMYRNLKVRLAMGADFHDPEISDQLDRVMEIVDKVHKDRKAAEVETDADVDTDTDTTLMKKKSKTLTKTVHPKKIIKYNAIESESWEEEGIRLGVWARSSKKSKLDLKKNLVPDENWSKEDCGLLEHLMERYENEKWLHMQAMFYNWTGRMVNAEIIEGKFKEDMGTDGY